MTDLRAKEQRPKEVARASEGVRGRIVGGEPNGQARGRQDVPKKRRGAEDTVAEAKGPVADKRPGREKPPETRGSLTVGFDVDGEAWDLTLEVRQLVGRDRRRRSYEFLIPRGITCLSVEHLALREGASPGTDSRAPAKPPVRTAIRRSLIARWFGWSRKASKVRRA
jgi:hypothetical protein